MSPAAVALIRKACEDKMHGSYALNTLKQLVLDRPRQRGEFLSSLLEFATYEDPVIRESCFVIAEELFKNSATHNSVLWHMTMYLQYLLSPNPPRLLFRTEAGRPSKKKNKKNLQKKSLDLKKTRFLSFFGNLLIFLNPLNPRHENSNFKFFWF